MEKIISLRKTFFLLLFCVATTLSIQAQAQPVIKTGYYTVDSTYDSAPYQNEKALEIIKKYKPFVDATTSLVIGESAQKMTAEIPESLLSNLFCDIILQTGAVIAGEPVDLSVLNMGGFRSSLPQGEVTIGTIFEIAPFENIVQVLYIKGEYISELLDFFAREKMQPMGNVQLEVHDKKVVKALINGKAIEAQKIYKLVTINYLAQGGDGMTMLGKAEKVIDNGLILRDAVIGYFLEKQKKGEKIDSKLDHRVVIR